MKILNISKDDWANFQHDNMKALRSVGLHCDSIKQNSHPFYTEESEIVPGVDEICRRITDYDVIQFFHDDVSLFQKIRGAIVGKKIIVYHTSSYYRKYHALINANMPAGIHKSVCAMPEFIGLGARNEIYMVGAVDTERLKPGRAPERPFKFAHYPSNPSVKGTAKIVELMAQTDANFVYSEAKVSYEEQLAKMQDCDVYIEMFTRRDGNGMPYGDFGITALEAAAMGKVVVTNFRHARVYKDYYQGFFMFAPSNEEEFLGMIREINGYTLDQMRWFQLTMTREWVETNHSYKATGEYFLKHILHE